MDRIVMEAQARCDELLEMFDDERLRLLNNWMTMPGNIDWMEIIQRPSPRVLTILGQSPAQDEKWANPKDVAKFFLEWIAARYWALCTANGLEIAASLEDVNMKPTRRCVRDVAQALRAQAVRPEVEDLLTTKYHVL